MVQAERDLKVARKINPLNTDHTANLGRLYSWWSGRAPDKETRQERGDIASNHYTMAVTLSPNNPNIWNEWAILFMDILNKSQKALEKLNHSLGLDELYTWTQGLMGDYYMRMSRSREDQAAKVDALEQAIFRYREAVQVATGKEKDSKIGYLVSLGNAYIEFANVDAENKTTYIVLAIDSYEQAVELKPKKKDLWKIEETIAKLYAQLGDKANALRHATAALDAAPDNQKERVQNLISQIESLP